MSPVIEPEAFSKVPLKVAAPAQMTFRLLSIFGYIIIPFLSLISEASASNVSL